jgi:5'(3')-deoxyribonucleotidase
MIFLDVDGVLADSASEFYKVHGRPDLNFKTIPQYDFSGTLGITYEQAWADPRVACYDFWRDLPKLPWADEVVEITKAKGQIAFLTQPIRSPMCAAGKKAWMAEHFPDVPFFICDKKVLLAREGLTLVDDYEKNVDAWNEKGGRGILFPAPYNELGYRENAAQYLRGVL